MVKLKRIKNACCGMENNKIYDGEIESVYARVLLPNGEWTAWHYMPGFFEIVQ